MPYIDQLSEIFGYFWEQVNWGSLSAYYPHALIFLSCLLFLFVLSKVFQYKRRVKEYIEDRICLRVDFSPMGDKESELRDLLAKLYKIHFDSFRRKYYFALEVVIEKNHKNLFLVLSRNVYEKILAGKLLQQFSVKDVTSDRDIFFNSMSMRYSGLELELSKDFIYPLHYAKDVKGTFPTLEDDEMIFIQLLSRPQGDKWKSLVEKAIKLTMAGKKIELGTQGGCVAGFLQIVAPFLNFLGDTMTLTIHGSRPQKSKIDDDVKQGIKESEDLLKEKIDDFGFETYLRILARGLDEERNYLILEKILDMLDSEGNCNSYVVDKTYTKPKKSFATDIELANLSNQSVDILNAKEISETINVFLNS